MNSRITESDFALGAHAIGVLANSPVAVPNHFLFERIKKALGSRGISRIFAYTCASRNECRMRMTSAVSDPDPDNNLPKRS